MDYGVQKMIKETMNTAFNKQINEELYSAYLYLSMSAYFEGLSLMGFANWMKIQTQEEVAHAMGMFDYLHSRDGKAILDTINKPSNEWSSPEEVFEAVLAHEQFVTSKIYELMDIADAEKDRAATQFLQWYVKEQVEEEDTANEILTKLRLIGSDPNALLLLDKDLAARVFVAPVIV